MNPDRLLKAFISEIPKNVSERNPEIFENIISALEREMQLPDDERHRQLTKQIGTYLAEYGEPEDPWDISFLMPEVNDLIPVERHNLQEESLPIAASVAPSAPASKEINELVERARERLELAEHYGVDDPDTTIELKYNMYKQIESFSADEAEMLPDEQLKRLSIASTRAEAVRKSEYDRVIKHWSDLMEWLRSRAFFTTNSPATRQTVLDQAQFLFPLFFRHPRPEPQP